MRSGENKTHFANNSIERSAYAGLFYFAKEEDENIFATRYVGLALPLLSGWLERPADMGERGGER